jgi:hypothetical protein
MALLAKKTGLICGPAWFISIMVQAVLSQSAVFTFDFTRRDSCLWKSLFNSHIENESRRN